MKRLQFLQRTLSVHCFPLALPFAATVLLAVTLPASTETVPGQVGKRSVNDLLASLVQAEQQGGSYRGELIDAVLKQSPNHPAARGLEGFVFYQGKWTPAATVALQLQKSENLRHIWSAADAIRTRLPDSETWPPGPRAPPARPATGTPYPRAATVS